MGRGREVIGGTLHTPLTPDDVRRSSSTASSRMVPRDAEPQRGGPHRPARDGPALRQRPGHHAAPGGVPEAAHAAPASAAPAAILFNGGVFQPAALRERLVEVHARLVRHAGPALAAAGADQSRRSTWPSPGAPPITPGCGTPAAGASAAASPGPITSASRAAATAAADGRTRPLTVVCVVPQRWKKGRRSSWRSRSWNWRWASR